MLLMAKVETILPPSSGERVIFATFRAENSGLKVKKVSYLDMA